LKATRRVFFLHATNRTCSGEAAGKKENSTQCAFKRLQGTPKGIGGANPLIFAAAASSPLHQSGISNDID
jgi:hypothetical protein